MLRVAFEEKHGESDLSRVTCPERNVKTDCHADSEKSRVTSHELYVKCLVMSKMSRMTSNGELRLAK